jgi:hypothetical protein
LSPDLHGFDWNKDGIGCEIGQSENGPVGTLPSQGTVRCGQVVQGSVTLTANLTCTGYVLIVGDGKTIINLNGYGIRGPGADSSKVGIGVSEDNVAINGPGIISGFQAGILATGAKELVTTSLIMQNNQIAAFFTGAAMFVARASTMGERKMVIYIPLEHHADVIKYFKGKQIKVTMEEAV